MKKLFHLVIFFYLKKNKKKNGEKRKIFIINIYSYIL